MLNPPVLRSKLHPPPPPRSLSSALARRGRGSTLATLSPRLSHASCCCPRRRCRCRGCHAALLTHSAALKRLSQFSQYPLQYLCSTYSEGGGGHRSIRKGRLIAVTSPPRLSVSGRDVRRSHESLNPPPPRAGGGDDRAAEGQLCLLAARPRCVVDDYGRTNGRKDGPADDIDHRRAGSGWSGSQS